MARRKLTLLLATLGVGLAVFMSGPTPAYAALPSDGSVDGAATYVSIHSISTDAPCFDPNDMGLQPCFAGTLVIDRSTSYGSVQRYRFTVSPGDITSLKDNSMLSDPNFAAAAFQTYYAGTVWSVESCSGPTDWAFYDSTGAKASWVGPEVQAFGPVSDQCSTPDPSVPFTTPLPGTPLPTTVQPTDTGGGGNYDCTITPSPYPEHCPTPGGTNTTGGTYSGCASGTGITLDCEGNAPRDFTECIEFLPPKFDLGCVVAYYFQPSYNQQHKVMDKAQDLFAQRVPFTYMQMAWTLGITLQTDPLCVPFTVNEHLSSSGKNLGITLIPCGTTGKAISDITRPIGLWAQWLLIAGTIGSWVFRKVDPHLTASGDE